MQDLLGHPHLKMNSIFRMINSFAVSSSSLLDLASAFQVHHMTILVVFSIRPLTDRRFFLRMTVQLKMSTIRVWL